MATPKKAVTAYEVEAWLAGYFASICGHPDKPPRKTCRASWAAGYAAGLVDCGAMNALHDLRRQPGGQAAASASHYLGVGTVAYTNGFKAGVRMAAGLEWRTPD